jgi:hypothetical protein
MIWGRTRLLRDPGTLWHTVVGERIFKTGRLIQADPFSFTKHGEHWIAKDWLADLGMAAVHFAGGLDGLLLATATMLAGLYAWLGQRLLRVGCHWLVSVLLVAITVLASAYHFHIRPHVLSIVFFGVLFARLYEFEAGRISLVRLSGLVPVVVLWTNTHPGALGGVATIALVLVGWSMGVLLRRPTPLRSPQQVAAAFGLIAACAAAVLVNPYGADLTKVWFFLSRSPVVRELIAEHSPLKLHRPEDWGVIVGGAVYISVLVGTFPARPTVCSLVPIVWLVLAFDRIRHGPLFAVAAIIAVAELLPNCRWFRWLGEHGSDLCRLVPRESGPWRPAQRIRTWLIPAAVVGLAVGLQTANVPVPVLGRGWATLSPDSFPTDLLPNLTTYAKEHADGAPICNDLNFGGFIIFFTPRLRVFIDDRCELYGEESLREYDQARRTDPARLDRWADRYGFDLVLTQSGSMFDRYLSASADWTEWQRGRTAVLFRRSGPP